MKGEPSDRVLSEDSFPSPAAETPTVIEKDDEGVSECLLSFVIEFAGILLRFTTNNDQWTALYMRLTDTCIDLNILSRSIESFVDCKNVRTRNTREPMKNEDFVAF